MEVLYFLLPVALCLAGFFVVWFILSVKSGQYDDINTPAYRMLLDDEKSEPPQSDAHSEPEKINESSK